MKKRHLQQWRDWRDDYRCARPPVSCHGCHTFYPPNEDAPVMVFEGYRLVHCSKCGAQKPPRHAEPEAIKKVMQSMQEGYLIIDEILFVATTKFGITASQSTIREALRQLWNNGQVKYRKNRFGQDCFALI